MFFNSPAPGVLPNYPIVHSIHEMQRQVSELNGELIAAGCTVVESLGEVVVEVPKGASAKVEDIIRQHREKFSHTVDDLAPSFGGENAKAEI